MAARTRSRRRSGRRSTAPTARRAWSRRRSWPAPARRSTSASTSRTASTSTSTAARPRRQRWPASWPGDGADVGFALDGDADRCVAVDERGQVVDGDQLIGIIALDRLARGALPQRHRGGQRAVQRRPREQPSTRPAGGSLRTPVGDKYILEAMLVIGRRPGRREERPRHHPRAHHHRRRHRHRARGAGHPGADRQAAVRAGRPNPAVPAAADAPIPVRHKDQWEADPSFAGAVERARGGRSLAAAGSSSGRRAPSRRCGSWSRAKTQPRVAALADSLAALAERATKLATGPF